MARADERKWNCGRGRMADTSMAPRLGTGMESSSAVRLWAAPCADDAHSHFPHWCCQPSLPRTPTLVSVPSSPCRHQRHLVLLWGLVAPRGRGQGRLWSQRAQVQTQLRHEQSCNPTRNTQPLWASVFSSVKGGEWRHLPPRTVVRTEAENIEPGLSTVSGAKCLLNKGPSCRTIRTTEALEGKSWAQQHLRIVGFNNLTHETLLGGQVGGSRRR